MRSTLSTLLVLVCSTQAFDIEHVVVLVMENRPFDHFFGFAQEQLPGIDGLRGTESCYFNVSDPSQGSETVANGKANYVCKSGPSQAFKVWCGDFFGPGVTDCAHGPYPSQDMSGFLQMNRDNKEVMWSFSPEQLPIKMALAQEFGIFDKFYSSFPGPSTPNHLFIQSATSAGCTNTGEPYQCISGQAFPQRTLYQNLEDNGHTWAYFYNDSAWNTFIEWFETPQGQAGLHTYDTFYDQAEKGTLPNFSFILPRQGTNTTTGQGSNDDHPCHDVALGERLLKDTYEALRAGAGWNKTLFLVTYDDAGGFYDHSPLPTRDVPPPDDIPSCSNPTKFDFLGPRLPTLIISPWVPKGLVIHEPWGEPGTVVRPFESSQFEHSSIAATVKALFGLPDFLTRRDAWAGTFHMALNLTRPREDTPYHLPEAPEPSSEHAAHSCVPPGELSRRHKRRIEFYEHLHSVQAPKGMEPQEAEAWILQQEQAHRTELQNKFEL